MPSGCAHDGDCRRSPTASSGSYAVQATNDLDYPAINGVALFAGFAFLIGNLVTDMLYAYADPKIRLA